MVSSIKASKGEIIWMFKNLMEETIVFGSNIKSSMLDNKFVAADGSKSVSYTVSNETTSSNIEMENQRFFRFLTEGYVFSYHRILEWIEAMQGRGYVAKPSPLRNFRNLWNKDVRELRDFLIHLEKYLVKGGGRRKDKYTANFGGIAADPTSTVSIEKSFIGGKYIEKVYLIGGRLDFLSSLQSLQGLYLELSKEGFFSQEAGKND